MGGRNAKCEGDFALIQTCSEEIAITQAQAAAHPRSNKEGRAELPDHLKQVLLDSLPGIADPELRDFMSVFADIAYRSDARRFSARILQHPWFIRMNAAQVRAAGGRYLPQSSLQELIDEATQEFAVRLLERPSLGIPPERVLELPGYMRNFAREVARQVWRQSLAVEQRTYSEAGGDASNVAFLPSDELGPVERCLLDEYGRAFRTFVTDEMDDDERAVLHHRFATRLPWDLAAAALGVTISKARTRAEKLLLRIQRHFGLSSNRTALLAFVDLLCTAQLSRE